MLEVADNSELKNKCSCDDSIWKHIIIRSEA